MIERFYGRTARIETDKAVYNSGLVSSIVDAVVKGRSQTGRNIGVHYRVMVDNKPEWRLDVVRVDDIVSIRFLE